MFIYNHSYYFNEIINLEIQYQKSLSINFWSICQGVERSKYIENKFGKNSIYKLW